MKKPVFDGIVEKIGEKRYKHILRVAETAVALAKEHDLDIEKAETAALFHDICKYKDADLLWKEAERLKVEHLDRFKAFPQVLHGYVAEQVAKIDYGITDEEVLRAIRYHTTGIDHMSPLEEVIFLADYLEPMRDFDGVDRLREMAKDDLDKAMAASVQNNLLFLVQRGGPIFPDTVRCYNDYMERIG
ncbi:MAG: bis(5'-nucleosyl)-tetraphosphatase (symmetrical) YqeK [Peptoniphilus sp.]|nr:bis(5'-nucleosyl)-tetraphosphatase (symmetrical) YqeK [Peptoniphilus sp.]MDY3118556.1 bis(5'-nucleosyl)-tetraphosphatase (symmetrical) YqeK [Peptoniphilus sp.]